jgi:formylglycine-generating enzyme required for sulfatase activity
VYSVRVKGVEVDWTRLAYEDIPGKTTAIVGNPEWNNATKLLNRTGYRLPCEMEWIWAAMGGKEGGSAVTSGGHAKPFAGSDGSNNIGDYAWISANAGNKTHEAGKKLPNELGLYDLSGNVVEWRWEEDGKAALARHSTPDASARIFRGGYERLTELREPGPAERGGAAVVTTTLRDYTTTGIKLEAAYGSFPPPWTKPGRLQGWKQPGTAEQTTGQASAGPPGRP